MLCGEMMRRFANLDLGVIAMAVLLAGATGCDDDDDITLDTPTPPGAPNVTVEVTEISDATNTHVIEASFYSPAGNALYWENLSIQFEVDGLRRTDCPASLPENLEGTTASTSCNVHFSCGSHDVTVYAVYIPTDTESSGASDPEIVYPRPLSLTLSSPGPNESYPQEDRIPVMGTLDLKEGASDEGVDYVLHVVSESEDGDLYEELISPLTLGSIDEEYTPNELLAGDYEITFQVEGSCQDDPALTSTSNPVLISPIGIYDDGDADGDGYNRSEEDAAGCENGDSDAAIHPGADELCDLKDNDCDGTIDEDLSIDGDGDGYKDCVTADKDCNDGDNHIYPGADELCNSKDDNCNERVDEGYDVDGDGFFPADCDPPAGQTDCDDNEDTSYPQAQELCDHKDNDCDGEIDEEGTTATTFYLDVDSDGYGAEATPVLRCYEEDGLVKNHDDCDDSNPDTYPGANDDCLDPGDNNCDGVYPRCLEGELPLASENINVSVSGDEGEGDGGLRLLVLDFNGDGANDVAVGVPGFDGPAGADSGRVYVMLGLFSFDSESRYFSSAQYIINGTASGQQLGKVMANGNKGLLGNQAADTLVLGVPLFNGSKGEETGAVFFASGKSLTEGSRLEVTLDDLTRIEGAAAGDQAGYSVSAGQDVMGSSTPDVLVGAPYADLGAGRVYLLNGASLSTTSLQNYSPAFTAESSGDHLGMSVLIAGDLGLSSQEFADFAMCAPDKVTDAKALGTCYVFAGNQTSSTSVTFARHIIHGPYSLGKLQLSETAVGDVNEDGKDDLLLSAPGDGTSPHLGEAYLLTKLSANVIRLESSWTGVATRIVSAQNKDSFAMSLGTAGNLDNAQGTDLLFGAPYHDVNTLKDTGAAYLIYGTASVFAPGNSISLEPLVSGILYLSGVSEYDYVGAAVAGGDLDGDGYPDIILGAPGYNVDDKNTGAVLIISGANSMAGAN